MKLAPRVVAPGPWSTLLVKGSTMIILPLEQGMREVHGYSGYAVKEDGSVWSCRPFQHIPKTEWVRVSGKVKREGYVEVGLRLGGGVRKFRYVHRLVLETFVGPCPDGMEACHNDGNRKNNHINNLRWDTRLANIHDKIKHGTIARGSMIGSAKLTEDEVSAAIQKYRDLGRVGKKKPSGSVKAIAAKLGVSPSALHGIIKGHSWRHVNREVKAAVVPQEPKPEGESK